MRKLRIAQVTNLEESVPPLNKNGREQVIYYLVEELIKVGHEVTLFATADSKTNGNLVPIWPKATSRDPEFWNLAEKNGWQFSTDKFEELAIATALTHENEFDIIHSHARFASINFAPFITTPFVRTLHSPVLRESFQNAPEPYFSALKESWYKNRSQIHTVMVSNFQKNKYDGPANVIHNGLPLINWSFSEIPGDYFAYLGYLTPDKGAAEAVQAILPTKEKLLLAGPIRDDDQMGKVYLKEKIEPFLNDRVKYVGPLTYEEKIPFLSNAKAVLMPIQWDEPFGMVAIEAMATGTPVIAWNRAAMPEIIEDGVSGFLVNSVEEMTEKIGQIDKINRRNCRKRIEEKFTVETMAKNYEALYYKILSSD